MAAEYCPPRADVRIFWMAGSQFSHLPLILKPTGQGKLSKGMALNLAFRSFPSTGMAAMAMNPIQVLGKKVSCPMPSQLPGLSGLEPWQRRRNPAQRPVDQFVLTGPHREIGSKI